MIGFRGPLAGSQLPTRVAAMLLWLLVGCGEPDSGSGEAVRIVPADSAVQAVDDAGRLVRLPRPARRIVSLLPATTETLVALGAADLLVGRTDYDDPSLAHLPSVGGGLTPSVEVLTSLQPDLVIAWEESGAARVRPRLEAVGIPVFAVATQDTAAVFANVERLGALTGMRLEADSLAGWMRSELRAVARSVADRPAVDVLYMIGVDPPMVAGPNVFIGEILEVAGGRNVFEDVAAPSPHVSLEEIVRRAPEVVLIPSTGASSASLERLRREPGWRELFESGDTRFHTLPPDILHRPGPSIVDAARVLRDAIHSESARPR
ncbi:MAG: helical backbone metal receptor [Gemmatimonadota bacterium]